MKTIFWNSAQGRLRAGWRLLVQGLLFFVGSLVLGFVAGVGFIIWRVLQPGGMELLADPVALQQALLDQNHIVFRLVSMALTVVTLVGSVWLAGRFLDRRRFRDFGFHLRAGWWLDLGFGLALGAVLMAGVFLVEWAAGWVTITGTLQASGQAFLPAILAALAGYIAVGFYEELLSRGYQLQNLAEGLNGRLLGARGGLLLAWFLSSAVFGLLHAGNPNATLVSTLNLIVAGLFLGLGYVLTGELAIPIGLHITWNFFQGCVFGFPVSGGQSGATFIAVSQGGPTLWTGGAFGPEAGLVGLAAILVGSLLIVGWVRMRQGRVGLWQPLAEPPQRAVATQPDEAAGQA